MIANSDVAAFFWHRNFWPDRCICIPAIFESRSKYFPYPRSILSISFDQQAIYKYSGDYLFRFWRNRNHVKKSGDLKSLGSKIISITNSSTNSLARQSDINLAYHLTPEYVDEEVNVTSQLPAVFLIETLARRNYNYMQQMLNNKL